MIDPRRPRDARQVFVTSTRGRGYFATYDLSGSITLVREAYEHRGNWIEAEQVVLADLPQPVREKLILAARDAAAKR